MYFYISSASTNLPPDVNAKYMNPFCTVNCLKYTVDGKLQCKCGEENDTFLWNWIKEDNCSNTVLSNNDRDILFHPVYSSGTAALRGNASFQQNQHYYWEIKMISNLYGTDVMVGVGNSKIVPADWKYRFCSMLGMDSDSWGYSYHGNIQHNKLVRRYGSKFGFGSLVGVHLDMYAGTLEYYLNRKPLGIAFRQLKGQELFPMVCSTAAQSAVRITCAVTEESTLQLKCLEFIAKHPGLYRHYRDIPGLTRQYDKRFFWIVPVDMNAEEKRKAQVEDDLMCPLQFKNFVKKRKNTRKNERPLRWVPSEIFFDLVGGNLSDSDVECPNIEEAPNDLNSSLSDLETNEVAATLENGPSTSKQCCDENCVKRVKRTAENGCKNICVKCKLRLKEEEMSDSSSSCSNLEIVL